MHVVATRDNFAFLKFFGRLDVALVTPRLSKPGQVCVFEVLVTQVLYYGWCGDDEDVLFLQPGCGIQR